SYPSRASSENIAGSSPVAGTPHTQKIEPWKFGKRQLGATLTGILICAGLISLILISTSNSFYSSSSTSSIVIACVLLGLTLATPEFLGAVFGPWVGLFIGSL